MILYLLTPWVLLRLWLKGFHVPAYRRDWKERFAAGGLHAVRGVIWIHAVSVGEVRAAHALIERLLQQANGPPVLITTTTPAGRDMVQRLFGARVSSRYLPYDLPGSVRRFLDAVQPSIALIMETEIWPNLYRQLKRRRIPLLLLNARLSEASVKGYLKLSALSRPAIACITHIAAQSREDEQRFIRLGAGEQQLSVVGNLKFDVHLPADFATTVAALKERVISVRRIWVAGSTHEGEERQLLEAHRRVLQAFPDALLFIAPRHPERARALARLCSQAGLESVMFSAAGAFADTARVVIVDTLGDLVYLYGLATVAFLGGSLTDRGGHNPVEAVLAGAPVVSGPSVRNFHSVYRQMRGAGAVRIVGTEVELADQLGEWFADENRRKAVAEAGSAVIEKNRGALQRCLVLVESALTERARG